MASVRQSSVEEMEIIKLDPLCFNTEICMSDQVVNNLILFFTFTKRRTITGIKHLN